MKVYTVLSMDDFSKRLSLEPFSTLELAMVRAAWIAHHVYGLIPNETPQPQNTGFSTDVEYVVFQDNESVIISVLEQEIRESLPHFRGQFTSGGDLSGSANPQTIAAITPPPPPSPVDDAMGLTLPAGWTHDGTPIRMDMLIGDANNIKCMNDLNVDQQFALTIARVSKRPNFSYPTDIGVLIQSSALSELKRRTNYGYDIMEYEMEFLENIRNTNIVIDIDD